MKDSLKLGLFFGISSGVVTTLGLMTGLGAGTRSLSIVLAGIFTIALADAMSDAMGVHLSSESNQELTQKDVWEATISTFLAKLIIAVLFVFPFLYFHIFTAIIINAVWGLVVLSILSFYIARIRKGNPWIVIAEHIGVAIFVLIATYFVGILAANIF